MKKTKDTKVATVCCSVKIRYKQAILAYVSQKGEGESLANIMGKVLEEWVDINELLKLVTETNNEDQEVINFE